MTPGIAEISLAVIAAASVIAVLVALPTVVQVRRTAARAEAVLREIEHTLPALIAQLRETAAKVDRAVDTVGGLAETVERVDRLTETVARTVGQAGTLARHMTWEVVGPSVANAAGLLGVLREGIQWVWPRRNRGRDQR